MPTFTPKQERARVAKERASKGRTAPIPLTSSPVDRILTATVLGGPVGGAPAPQTYNTPAPAPKPTEAMDTTDGGTPGTQGTTCPPATVQEMVGEFFTMVEQKFPVRPLRKTTEFVSLCRRNFTKNAQF